MSNPNNVTAELLEEAIDYFSYEYVKGLEEPLLEHERRFQLGNEYHTQITSHGLQVVDYITYLALVADARGQMWGNWSPKPRSEAWIDIAEPGLVNAYKNIHNSTALPRQLADPDCRKHTARFYFAEMIQRLVFKGSITPDRESYPEMVVTGKVGLSQFKLNSLN